jgi:hypothetical protein
MLPPSWRLLVGSMPGERGVLKRNKRAKGFVFLGKLSRRLARPDGTKELILETRVPRRA